MQRETWQERVKQAFGPILAGAVIDGIDLFTMGPLGIVGFVLGGWAGYWLGALGGLSKGWCMVVGVITACYCMSPPTTLLPLATLAGAGIRLFRPSPAADRTRDGLRVEELPEAEADVKSASDRDESQG